MPRVVTRKQGSRDQYAVVVKDLSLKRILMLNPSNHKEVINKVITPSQRLPRHSFSFSSYSQLILHILIFRGQSSA